MLSTASVPITVLLYNGPLLCGFNVGIKGLITPAKAEIMRSGRSSAIMYVFLSHAKVYAQFLSKVSFGLFSS